MHLHQDSPSSGCFVLWIVLMLSEDEPFDLNRFVSEFWISILGNREEEEEEVEEEEEEEGEVEEEEEEEEEVEEKEVSLLVAQGQGPPEAPLPVTEEAMPHLHGAAAEAAFASSAASLSPPPRCHSDDEEEDLNKAFDVQGFQQILCPAVCNPPEKHRVYDEQDFEDHRHFSLHVHHPLSKPPADGRRKRINEGRKEDRRGSAYNTAATIEEDQEEEESGGESYSQNDEEEGQRITPASDLPTMSTNHNGLSPGCITGSVATEEADEGEALMSVNLEDIKSHRLDDIPAVRRHLVRRSSRGPIVHLTKDQISGHTQSHLQHLQHLHPDRTPHEVFVELNELVIDRNQELQWRETARWIKFEEEVEEETERWGRPHIPSLSFRSLLELRKTISHGAVLLDLKQKTLPGIAQQVVEQMVISDQIKAEDRANVLRALLLRHSHPSDEKDHSLFSKNISAANMATLIDRHNGQSEPSISLTNHREADGEKTKVKETVGSYLKRISLVSVCWLSPVEDEKFDLQQA
ncbi:anion exchange protein 2-like [Chaetodon trifascialis]|uniref:anion exchange protein 2-like n=1 Tax=Chaetodon trifascialis TaxID=109706 RepID=UPI003995E54B